MILRASFQGTSGMVNIASYWIALISRAGRDQVILVIFMTLLAFMFATKYARLRTK